ncbi:hypothetical protein [Paenibacillus sp. sgz500958]|uniref:hypothetical protein n=1 Tax=Paenibacillus sp. sgz500958 TaxID=3242475 RepID=UPI0036D3D7E2
MKYFRIFSFFFFILTITGCVISNNVDIETKAFESLDSEIEFKYPVNWIVTDKSMSSGVIWLVVSETEYKVIEGNHWPFINIYAFKDNDKDFINKQVERLTEYNQNKVLKKSKKNQWDRV